MSINWTLPIIGPQTVIVIFELPSVHTREKTSPEFAV